MPRPQDRLLRRWTLLVPLLLGLLLAVAPRPALAIDPDQLLPIDQAFVFGGALREDGHVALHWDIAEGYYLYRHRIRLLGAEGFEPEGEGELQLPDGEAFHDEFFGDVETYRHRLQATLPGRVLPGRSSITLELTYQGCADIGICYPPHRQTLVIDTPVTAGALPGGLDDINRALRGGGGGGGGGGLDLGLGGHDGARDTLPLPEAQAFGAEAISGGPNGLLLRLTPAPGYYLYRDNTTLAVSTRSSGVQVAIGEVRWPPAVQHEDEFFGESAVYFDQIEVPVVLLRSSTEAVELEVELGIQGCQVDGICYPPMTRRFTLGLPGGGTASEIAEGGAPGTGTGAGSPTIWLALLLALGGGVILNLMPCVLPILSLKALSLADGGRSRAHARASALWYSAGVLVSFAAIGALVLALRAAGLALGWGFQLQQPVVIALLVYLMLAIGLNLSGVFSIGARLAGTGQGLTEKHGAAGDFFTGVLAVVVASPCTAPFMGAALAFAFAAPPALAIAVFLALGLGLALPFLLIGFIPALAARLPRPGAWMDGFKQFLAFPMYAVAAWLVSVLAAQRGADGVLHLLVGAVLLALGLWWLERRRFREGWVPRAAAWALIALAFVPVWSVSTLPPPQRAPAGAEVASGGAVPYSAQRLQVAREQGRAVFVNMTADWCVTCKANERRVLSGAGFRDALEAADAVYMVGDWTNVDPEITRFLASHNAVGVPLYVVYPADGGAPTTLPTVLSTGMVRSALEQAAR